MSGPMAPVAISTVPGVPATLRWIGAPVEASLEDATLSISAGPRSDWFIDPRSGTTTLNAPGLVGPLAGDFTLSSAS